MRNKLKRRENPDPALSGHDEEDYLSESIELKLYKIEKFKRDNKPKLLPMIINLLLISLVFIFISLVDFFSGRNSINTVQTLIENHRSVEELEKHVSYSFSAFYESTARVDPDMSYNDKNILDNHIEAITLNKKKVINFIGSSYPSELEEYTTNLKNIMSNNLCDFFLKQEVNFGRPLFSNLNYFTSNFELGECNSTLYDSGLDTILVYYTQTLKNLNSELKSDETAIMATKILNSNTFGLLSKSLS